MAKLAPMAHMKPHFSNRTVNTGIKLTHAHSNSPPSKLAAASMSETGQKNLCLWRKHDYWYYYLIDCFPHSLDVLNLVYCFFPFRIIFEGKWVRVSSGGSLLVCELNPKPSIHPGILVLLILLIEWCCLWQPFWSTTSTQVVTSIHTHSPYTATHQLPTLFILYAWHVDFATYIL